MRSVCACLVVCILAPALTAADPPAKKEPIELAAARVMFERKATAAKAEYDAAMKKLQAEYVEDLKNIQKELSTKADLDGAIAARKAAETAGAEAGKVKEWSPSGQTWTWYENKVRFESDGRMTYDNPKWKANGADYHWKVIAPRVIAITLENDRTKDGPRLAFWVIDDANKIAHGSNHKGEPFNGAAIVGGP